MSLPTRWRRVILAVPAVWLALFFLVPMVLVAGLSVSTARLGSPPFEPVWVMVEGWPRLQASLANYQLLLDDPIYWDAVVGSVTLAGFATLGCLAIGFPLAYAIARAPAPHRVLLVMLVMVPFWTSFLIRTYAWVALLQTEGLINGALLALGLVREPLSLIATDGAVLIGVVYTYLPFMVLPLYAALEKFDWQLLEAAADLGATPTRAFWSVTLPLAVPGLLAGSLLVFIPVLGEYVVPALLGGADQVLIGGVVWTEFFGNRDWPLAAALAIVLLALVLVPILWLQTLRRDGVVR
ncbi:MAG: ABC transporter permease subunit [Alphaproteobacteria bacterium]|nr:MAG: ABC transporter permease subunit [Alphaproteobacteria bacterium]